MTYHPSGFQNTSCKSTSRTKSICLKDTLVTGALLRDSATDSKRATTIMFRYTLNSYLSSKTYSSEQLKLSFMYITTVIKQSNLVVSLKESTIACNFDISVFITLSNI